MRSLRNGSARQRNVWTLADQGLSSATNFVLGVLVARSVSAHGFGVFSLLYSGYLLALGVTRSVVAEPLLARHSDVTAGLDDAARRTAAVAVRLALAGAAAVSVILVIAGAIVGGQTGATVAVFGAGLPGLLVQDVFRHVFFAGGVPERAFLNDLLWASLQAVAIGVLLVANQATMPLLAAAWVAPALVCSTWAARLMLPAASGKTARHWIRDHRDLIPAFTAEFLVGHVTTVVVLGLVGVIVGVEAAGALRGAQLLLGPLRVAFLAVPSSLVPEGRRLLALSGQHLHRAIKLVGGGSAALAIVAGVLGSQLPVFVGRSLLGETWPAAQGLLIPTAMGMAAIGVTTSSVAGLRVLAAAGSSLRARLLVTPVAITSGLLGAAIGGVQGAAYATAGSSAFAAAMYWVAFRRALRIETVAESVERMGAVPA